MTLATRRHQLGIDYWAEHPDYFIERVLGDQMYDKQHQMCELVRDNRRTAIVGCNGSGKDFTAGRILLWWQNTRYPAKTVVIGPTHRQVNDIVFAEARAAYLNASFELPGQTYKTSRYWLDDDHFAIGFAVSDEYKLQGYHSPNLLVILTEAHNIPQNQIDAVKRLNPTRILMTGNPLSNAGEFYEAFHELSDMYATLQISAFDSPNVIEDAPIIPGLVTTEDVQERKREYGEESALYIAGVLGQFPDNLEDGVVPRSLLLDAVQRQLAPQGDVILACDVARFGEDRTVVYRRQGFVARKVWDVQGRDTQEIAGRLIGIAQSDDVSVIVVDDNGVGGGVTDRLREESGRFRARVHPFNGGAAARESHRFANAITEAWYAVAAAARAGELDIEDDPALIGQLSSRRYKVLGTGKTQLESKNDYKKRARRSPDQADALAMTYAARSGGFKVWV